jgi:hypothetical protein
MVRDRSNRVVGKHCAVYDAVQAKYGGKQARLLARLLATIRWLQEVDGTRATYDLLSACADDLLTNWPDQAA